MPNYVFKTLAGPTITGTVFTREMSVGAGTSGFATTGNIASGVTTIGAFTTPVDIPGTNGMNGDFIAFVRLTTTNSQIQIAASLQQVGSTGTVKATSATTAEQSGNSSTLVFNLSTAGWTWATGDRLRLRFHFRNSHAMNAQSITMGVGTLDDYLEAPDPVIPFLEVNRADTLGVVVDSESNISLKALGSGDSINVGLFEDSLVEAIADVFEIDSVGLIADLEDEDAAFEFKVDNDTLYVNIGPQTDIEIGGEFEKDSSGELNVAIVEDSSIQIINYIERFVDAHVNLTENQEVQISGDIPVVRPDTLGLQLAESREIAVFISRVDSLAVGLAEARQFADVVFTRPDTLGLQLGETRQIEATSIPYSQYMLGYMTGHADDAYWEFEETGGTSLLDSSPALNHGVIDGGVTYNIAGKVGRALRFNGTNAWANIPQGLYRDGRPYSINGWFRGSNPGVQRPFYMEGENENASGQQWFLGLGSAGDGRVELDVRRTQESFRYTLTSTTSVTNGEWHQITVTDDMVTVRLYVDGQLEASGPTATFNLDELDRAAFAVRNRANLSNFLNGDLDEWARLPNVVLQPASIQQLYDIGMSTIDESGNKISSDELFVGFDEISSLAVLSEDHAVNIVDNVNVEDATIASRHINIQIVDAVEFQDDYILGGQLSKSTEDNLNVSINTTTSISSEGIVQRTINDDLNITDSNSVTNIVLNQSDQLGIEDSVAYSLFSEIIITDQVGIEDNNVFSSDRVQTDSVGIEDNISLTHASIRTITDDVSIQDTELGVELVAGQANKVTDDAIAIGLDESSQLQSAGTILRTINDNINVEDSGASTNTTFIRSDSIGITDELEKELYGGARNLAHTVFESLWVTDADSPAVYEELYSGIDNVGISDDVVISHTGSNIIQRTFVENIGLNDQGLQAGGDVNITIVDNVGVVDEVGVQHSGASIQLRTITDAVGIVDVGSASMEIDFDAMPIRDTLEVKHISEESSTKLTITDNLDIDDNGSVQTETDFDNVGLADSITTMLSGGEWTTLVIGDNFDIIDSGSTVLDSEYDLVRLSDNLEVSVEGIEGTSKFATDDLALYLDEDSSVALQEDFAEIEVQDSLAVQLGETRQVGVNQTNIGRSDSLTVSITQTSGIFTSGVIDKQSSDILNVAVGPATYGVISVSSGDDINVSLTEGRSFAPQQLNRTHTLTVSISESRNVQQTGTFIKTANDTFNIVLGEASGGTQPKNASDNIAISLNELSSFGGTNISRVQTIELSLVETSEILVPVNRNDAINTYLTELSDRDISGLVIKQSVDNFSIGITSQVSTQDNPVFRPDDIGVVVSEATMIRKLEPAGFRDISVSFEVVERFAVGTAELRPTWQAEPPVRFSRLEVDHVQLGINVEVATMRSTIELEAPIKIPSMEIGLPEKRLYVTISEPQTGITIDPPVIDRS